MRLTCLAAACLAGVAYVCLRAQPEHAVHQESIGIFTVLGAPRNSSMIFPHASSSNAPAASGRAALLLLLLLCCPGADPKFLAPVPRGLLKV